MPKAGEEGISNISPVTYRDIRQLLHRIDADQPVSDLASVRFSGLRVTLSVSADA